MGPVRQADRETTHKGVATHGERSRVIDKFEDSPRQEVKKPGSIPGCLVEVKVLSRLSALVFKVSNVNE